MATMYETIMSLPLFKGISRQQVSTFLEKTHVQFINYNPGERIVSVGDACTHIRYIISGDVVVTSNNYSGNLVIEEKRSTGTVLAPEYLFGMDRSYPFDVVAAGNVSVMQFSKEQYLALLQSDSIYMINYLNYLSYHSQRPINAIKLMGDGSFESQLALWVMSLTDARSQSIRIKCTRDNLLQMTHVKLDELLTSLAEMKSQQLIDFTDDEINIQSRHMLLDYVTNKLEQNIDN